MKITKTQIENIWKELNKNKCKTKITCLFSKLFEDSFWDDININPDNDKSDNISAFCYNKFKGLKTKTAISNECDKIQAIINVFEMQKLKQNSTKQSQKFVADQDALDKILNGLIHKIMCPNFDTQNINNIINLKFYPTYRKLILKEFLLQNHKRIAFEKDIFDTFSSKHISFMEGPFFWGIVENLHQGKKYWQYFMSEGAKLKLELSDEDLNVLDKIHSAAKSGSGIRLDHIIPRASLRTYFEKLCCEANKKTSDEEKIKLINTKVDWIYPYLVGCLVTTEENNLLKKQINPKKIYEHEVESPLDLYEESKQDPNYLNSAKNLFKTYCDHNEKETEIKILYFKENSWADLILDNTKDVENIINDAKNTILNPKTQSD